MPLRELFAKAEQADRKARLRTLRDLDQAAVTRPTSSTLRPASTCSALRSSALPRASLCPSAFPFFRLKSYFDSDRAEGSRHQLSRFLGLAHVDAARRGLPSVIVNVLTPASRATSAVLRPASIDRPLK